MGHEQRQLTDGSVAIISSEEMLELAAEPRDWGPWRLDLDNLVLYPVEPYRYEIDLESCTNSAEVLDRICQVAGKSWADDATLAGLVRALDDMLAPQANLCSSGEHKTIRPSKLKALLRQRGRLRAQRFG